MSRGGWGQGDNREAKPHEVTRLGQLGKRELRGIHRDPQEFLKNEGDFGEQSRENGAWSWVLHLGEIPKEFEVKSLPKIGKKSQINTQHSPRSAHGALKELKVHVLILKPFFPQK